MTVIEFGKRDLKINKLIVVLVVILVLSGVSGIALYNTLIGLRHDVENNETHLSQLQVQNAELKSKLDSMLQSALDPAFAASRGLILEKNPSYVTVPAPVISQR